MISIPPLSIRQIRPCLECSFCYGEYPNIGCTLEKDVSEYDFRGEMSDPYPCSSNFTADEIQELIDKHNKQEADA